MKKILTVLLVFISLLAIAEERFATVDKLHVDLLNDEGVVVKKLTKGVVVKVIAHEYHKDINKVLINGDIYFARRSSFKTITSVLNEEQRLLAQRDSLEMKIEELANTIDVKKSVVSKYNKRILELSMWIEVQSDTSFSKAYFLEKTKKSIEKLKVNKLKQKSLSVIIARLNDEKNELESQLAQVIDSYNTLTVKLRPLKIEKKMYEDGFIALDVVSKDTPVYKGGKVIRYLNPGTVIKARRDETLTRWFVFMENHQQYHISSSHVRAR